MFSFSIVKRLVFQLLSPRGSSLFLIRPSKVSRKTPDLRTKRNRLRFRRSRRSYRSQRGLLGWMSLVCRLLPPLPGRRPKRFDCKALMWDVVHEVVCDPKNKHMILGIHESLIKSLSMFPCSVSGVSFALPNVFEPQVACCVGWERFGYAVLGPFFFRGWEGQRMLMMAISDPGICMMRRACTFP